MAESAEPLSALRRINPQVDSLSACTPRIAGNSAGTLCDADSLSTPQCSSGRSQSRPDPARTVKIRQVRGNTRNSRSCAAQLEQEGRSPAEVQGDHAAILFSVNVPRLAQWAERLGSSPRHRLVSRVPYVAAVTLRDPQSGVSPVTEKVFQ